MRTSSIQYPFLLNKKPFTLDKVEMLSVLLRGSRWADVFEDMIANHRVLFGDTADSEAEIVKWFYEQGFRAAITDHGGQYLEEELVGHHTFEELRHWQWRLRASQFALDG